MFLFFYCLCYNRCTYESWYIMKKKLLTFPMLGLLAISSFGFALKTNSVQPVVEVRAARETVAEYYSSISDNLSGQELTKALNSLNNKKRISIVK